MTQDAFITLTCPNCGGKREVKPSTGKVICSYCGSEFMVTPQMNKEIMESASACPICHRNDRVEKVSSILASQVQHIQGTTLERQEVHTKKGKVKSQMVASPYNATQSSTLAQRLVPPKQPYIPGIPKQPKLFNFDSYIKSGRTRKIYAIIIAVLSILMGIFMALTPTESNYTISDSLELFLCCPIIFLPIAGFLWFNGNYRQHIKDHPEAIEKLEQKPHLKQSEYNKFIEDREKRIASYQRATQNWNNLYYCFRDDCMFVPGKGKSAPVGQLQEYLYSV